MADFSACGAGWRSLARARGIVCLALLSISGAAQSDHISQTTLTAQTNQPVERQMRLQVVDVETGRPVPNVRVRAWVRAEPTDASGVCVLPIPKPESANFSYKVLLTKDGYVGQYITWSKTLGDKPETIPTNFTAKLEKGVSIGGVVKNDNGEPVPGAKIVFNGPPPGEIGERVRTVVAPGYHAERTDAGGKWHFDEAPRDFETMTFRVSEPEYVPVIYACQGSDTTDDTIVLLPKADFLAGTAAMTLGHGIELSGRVLDPSGKPVTDATMTRNHEWRNPSAELMTDTNGGFKITNLRPGEMYLTIQASGLAGQTHLLTLSNHMPELDIHMARGKVLQGKVVDPFGKPIAGAAVQMDRMELGPIEFEWSATTDAQGRFSWDSAPEGEHPYCFSAAGYRPRTEPTLLANGQDLVITLRPVTDAQIEIDGRVTDTESKAPLTNFTVYVKQYNGPELSHVRQTFTNTDGNYSVFVPVSDSAYVISVGSARHKVGISNMKSVGDGDVRLDFALEGGFATTGLLYNLTGRFAITGYDGKVPWTNRQEMELSAVVPMPVLAATDEDGQRAEFEKFLETPEGMVWQRAHRSYEVEVDDTGAFKIQDVPEGPYKLQVRLHDPADGSPIAQFASNINVPDSTAKTNTDIDLGSLDLALKKALHVADAAPPFEVKTVDGLPLRLADFHGKYVIVDFWATWCHPCVAEVPFLKATYKAFGANPNFAMISLSVDDTPNLPKEFARKNEVKWIQGFLGKWSDSNVTPAYGVDGIPSIFLIGPDGKIIARDLRGDAIREAVGKVLGATDAN